MEPIPSLDVVYAGALQKLRRVVGSVVRRHPWVDGDDLGQMAAIGFCRGYASYRRDMGSTIEGWCLRIARGHALEEVRNQSRHAKRFVAHDNLSEIVADVPREMEETPVNHWSAQRDEARGNNIRCDVRGRTSDDMTSWRRFLRGWLFVVLVVASNAYAAEVTGGEMFPATPGIGPTVACTEPTTQSDGRPLGATLAAGGLAGCFTKITDNANAVVWEGWLRPPVPSGGARHDLGEYLPTDISRYPVSLSCACFNAMGWGPSAVGRVSLVLIKEGN